MFTLVAGAKINVKLLVDCFTDQGRGADVLTASGIHIWKLELQHRKTWLFWNSYHFKGEYASSICVSNFLSSEPYILFMLSVMECVDLACRTFTETQLKTLQFLMIFAISLCCRSNPFLLSMVWVYQIMITRDVWSRRNSNPSILSLVIFPILGKNLWDWWVFRLQKESSL